MAEQTNPTNLIDDLIPLTDWPNRHPWPPLGGLRHLVFHADKNGFNAVIRRVGKRILISESAFRAWVDGQNTPATPNARPPAVKAAAIAAARATLADTGAGRRGRR